MNPTKPITHIAAALMLAGAAGVLALAAPQRAQAQSTTLQNVIPPSDAVALQAKIVSINEKTRTLKLRGADGEHVEVVAGPGVRLQLLKAGDTVNVQYYRSVVFALSAPQGGNGVPSSNDQFSQVLARPVTAPGGVAVQVVTISGTIVAIDLAANSLSVVNPSGGKVYTVLVTDPGRIAMLPSLHVGDTVSAVVSQVLAISVTPAAKHWW